MKKTLLTLLFALVLALALASCQEEAPSADAGKDTVACLPEIARWAYTLRKESRSRS